MLEQDRALDAQRFRDRLETAAGKVTRELERELTAWETLAQHAADDRPPDPPAHAALVVFDDEGIVEQRGIGLPYQPYARPNDVIAPAIFADAEAPAPLWES